MVILSSLQRRKDCSTDLTIPGPANYCLTHMVLNVNGTVACGGHFIDGVREHPIAS